MVLDIQQKFSKHSVVKIVELQDSRSEGIKTLSSSEAYLTIYDIFGRMEN